MKQHLVLVMEMCDYDLDYLVRKSPFREDDITLLLFQLGEREGGSGGGLVGRPFLSRNKMQERTGKWPVSISGVYAVLGMCAQVLISHSRNVLYACTSAMSP